MRKIYRPIAIVIMAVICLCHASAAPGNAVKPEGTKQQMDVLITTKGKTTMGFLSNQPLDIHDVASITITSGKLDQVKDSDDGTHMVAYRRFYYFVDSSVPAYEVSLQVTPMFCIAPADGTPVKGPDISMTVGHMDAEFGLGSGAFILTGVVGEADAAYKDIAVNSSTVLMDQTHSAHWEAFSIYADLDDSLHLDAALKFSGKMKLVFTAT